MRDSAILALREAVAKPSRLLYGARTSLVVGLAATVLGAAAGSTLGLLAGFVGRWADQVVMRSIDTLAMATIATLGPGLVNGMVAVAIVNIRATAASCAPPCWRSRPSTRRRPAPSTSPSCAYVAPHVAALPGLAIFLAVLGFNLLGDGLRDALDPRLG